MLGVHSFSQSLQINSCKRRQWCPPICDSCHLWSILLFIIITIITGIYTGFAWFHFHLYTAVSRSHVCLYRVGQKDKPLVLRVVTSSIMHQFKESLLSFQKDVFY